ncbi:MAG TPA: hypothetical protein VML55_11870 [Planctomycetaceae bacterium]|nr:hypothetical protein [Planctomycetaceae bacterium]
MTGYTVHTGSTKKFSQGWDRIFTGKTAGKKQSRGKKPSRAKGKK